MVWFINGASGASGGSAHSMHCSGSSAASDAGGSSADNACVVSNAVGSVKKASTAPSTLPATSRAVRCGAERAVAISLAGSPTCPG
jgi:hypothetical protein